MGGIIYLIYKTKGVVNIKNRSIIIVIFLIIVCSISGYVVYKKNDIREEKKQYTLYSLENTEDIKSYTLDDIKKLNNNKDVDVTYNEKGLVKSISGKFTDKLIENDKDAIYAMYNVKDLFGFVDPNNEFTLKKIDENQDQVIYRFQQIYQGYMVYSNEIIITVDNKGNAASIIGKYTPIIDIDLINTIDKKEAVEAVSNDCRKGSKYELQKVVYVDKNDDSIEPAWMIKCTNKKYFIEDKTIFINANSGEKISEVPLTIN